MDLPFHTRLTGTKRIPVDVSRRLEPTKVELAPYAKDTETGEILNDSPFKILVDGEIVDVQAKIQSYVKDVDLYSILKRAAAGDVTALDQKKGVYADIGNLSSDPQQVIKDLEKSNQAYSRLSADDKKLVFASDEEVANVLEKALNGIIERNKAAAAAKTEKTEVKE